MKQNSICYIGIMSGTSLDGIDIALVNIVNGQTRLVASLETPFTESLHQLLSSIITNKTCNIADIGNASYQLACEYAAAVNQLLQTQQVDANEIKAIGAHGQTVFHDPNSETPHSTQLLNASVLAAKTGITCVHNFREMDVSLGGQGAPLVPLFHQSLLAQINSNKHKDSQVFANIGGIANLTICHQDTLLGFDSGPGNTLIDGFTQQAFDQPYDRNGDFAKQGKINQELLKQLLDDDYFALPTPKSTGREYFNLTWLRQKCAENTFNNHDMLATLTELTALTIASPIQSKVGTLVLCGGGAKNAYLVARLQHHLPDWHVTTSDNVGVSADFMEAMAFAWMAYRTLNHLPANAPSVTGANKAAVLGQITFAP
ncbi:anhydro-N-acetylmuramic acid kinase [Pseudoalteromonas sp. P1-9]|uniref:anhydro-N-acetylmuramic acid kinase n=1 Tax=Pseudoalteromonas sp. P1-9 TaxID=1710354 RepID=UPI00137922E6|nr:anhydro-N-acetylmuramic acid kinase [Pseudoalteromonas sp. P1-9]